MTNVRYHYLREEGSPVACLAIKLDGEYVYYQVSSMSLQDKGYKKILGRQIAENRLKVDPIVVKIPSPMVKHSITYEVVKDIASHTYEHGVKSSISRRIINVAKNWLDNHPVRESVND